MSEWNSVLAVYWVLWAVDAVRLAPQRLLQWRSGWREPGGAMDFERLGWVGLSPAGWRVPTADVPLSLSPVGVSSRPAGVVGRPAEPLPLAQAYRWEDIREVGVAAGWVYVNGKRFYPDTGHLTAPQLLALAQLAPAAREARIRTRLRLWLRPAHLRRRARVLRGRTATVVKLNALALTLMGAVTAYLITGTAAAVAPDWANAVAAWIPYVIGAWAVLHVAGVVAAFRALRHLPPATAKADKRRSALSSALIFPPQSMRLRAQVAEGFFPAQHPVALGLALAGPADREQWAFHAVADLRWPIDDAQDTPLIREITAWYRGALAEALAPVFTAAGIKTDALLAVPAANSPSSCTYCPRCRDQFTAGRTTCPHGVALLPLVPGVPREPHVPRVSHLRGDAV